MNQPQEKLTTEAEWLEFRKSGIGASEVATILGENRWGSAYELWALKTGAIEGESQNENMYWGHKLEPLVADEYAIRTGNKVIDYGRFATLRHPDMSALFATVDRGIKAEDRPPGALECKVTDSKWHSDWGSDWEETAPLVHQIQVQAQLAVRGWEWGVLAVLRDKRYMHIEIARDDEFIELMLEAVGEFWSEHVETGDPPPVDGTKATRRALKRLHPKDSGVTIALPDSVVPWVETWDDQRTILSQAKKRKEEAEAYIFEAMGESTWATLPKEIGGGRLQWKVQSKKAYSVEESESRVLRRIK